MVTDDLLTIWTKSETGEIFTFLKNQPTTDMKEFKIDVAGSFEIVRFNVELLKKDYKMSEKSYVYVFIMGMEFYY